LPPGVTLGSTTLGVIGFVKPLFAFVDTAVVKAAALVLSSACFFTADSLKFFLSLSTSIGVIF